MNKMFSGMMASIAAIACVATAVPASAQWRDRNHNGRPDRVDRREAQRWNTYNRQHGYNGYNGRWREGQRFSNYRNSRYYLNDWRARNLPPPRRGYRYYRDDSGDIVMAAIATGAIGLILGGALSR